MPTFEAIPLHESPAFTVYLPAHTIFGVVVVVTTSGLIGAGTVAPGGKQIS